MGLFHHFLVYMGDLQLVHLWVVAWSNLVSAQGPLVLGLGLRGLGPGLDNINNETQRALSGSLDSLFPFAGLKIHTLKSHHSDGRKTRLQVLQERGAAGGVAERSLSNMSKCNLSIRKQEGGAARAVAEGP